MFLRALGISACLSIGIARGQTLMHDIPSPGAGDHFGTAVTFLADLNGELYCTNAAPLLMTP